MVTEVKRFKANDGQVFKTEKEAEDHEKILALQEWYEEHKLSGSTYGSSVSWDDFIDWLIDHRDEAKAILKLYK